MDQLEFIFTLFFLSFVRFAVYLCDTSIHTRYIDTCLYSDGQRTDVLELQHELLNAVQRTMTLYAKRVNPGMSVSVMKRMTADYMLKMQGEAFSNIVSSVPATAEYLWTSGKKHQVVHNLEFCTVLNSIIRADLASELEVTGLSNHSTSAYARELASVTCKKTCPMQIHTTTN